MKIKGEQGNGEFWHLGMVMNLNQLYIENGWYGGNL